MADAVETPSAASATPKAKAKTKQRTGARAKNDELGKRITELQANAKEWKREKARMTKELKAAQRARSRTLANARRLSDKDLLECLKMRELDKQVLAVMTNGAGEGQAAAASSGAPPHTSDKEVTKDTKSAEKNAEEYEGEEE